MRFSSSADSRHRYEPSGTTSGSAYVPMFLVQGPAQDLRHPCVVFDGGGALVVARRDGVAGHLVPERRLPYAALAEGGQHLGDVREEGGLGPRISSPPRRMRWGWV